MFVQKPIDINNFKVIAYGHPQGCRTYLIIDTASKETIVLDLHLDFTFAVEKQIKDENLILKYIVDTHTHADHPSGAAKLAEKIECIRVAHEKSQHKGVSLFVNDGDKLSIGAQEVEIIYTPGHTPDCISLLINGAWFAGDSLFIDSVARTDFIGGDAGTLFDSLQKTVKKLPADTLVFPGHDYNGKYSSTVAAELENNPWLKMEDRAKFIEYLTANPPPRPANMDMLLQYNRETIEFPTTISAAETAKLVEAGGAASIIDVRTAAEYQSEHIDGSTLITLDQINAKLEQAMAIAAPRLLLCRSGARAKMAQNALTKKHVEGLQIIEGGIMAYMAAGGKVIKGKSTLSIERQVRIGAGGMVLFGLLLAWLISPYFALISAFVGCGLIFAGVTDWCGMALILGKMPWNNSSSCDISGGSGGGNCAAKAPSSCSANLPPE